MKNSRKGKETKRKNFKENELKGNYKSSKGFKSKEKPKENDFKLKETEVIKDAKEKFILAGRNPIIEAISSGKQIEKILLKDGELVGSVRSIIPLAKEHGIKVERITRKRLEELADGANHQGVLAFLPAVEYSSVTDIVNFAEEKGENPFIIILNHIEDPYNLGAIIRTACASGAHGVVIPNSRAAGLGPAVVKASAGSVSNIKIARVSNIVNTIEYLKKRNIWVACANMKGTEYFKEDFRGAIALVIGGENKGTTDNIRKKCDFTVSIPMYGEIESLNASVAAGLLMYEVVRRRHFPKT